MNTPVLPLDKETIAQLNQLADAALRHLGVQGMDLINALNTKLNAAAVEASKPANDQPA